MEKFSPSHKEERCCAPRPYCMRCMRPINCCICRPIQTYPTQPTYPVQPTYPTQPVQPRPVYPKQPTQPVMPYDKKFW